MILYGLRDTDNPGLDPVRLATGGAIDLQIPRTYPRCMRARLCLAEALMLGALTALMWLVLVALP